MKFKNQYVCVYIYIYIYMDFKVLLHGYKYISSLILIYLYVYQYCPLDFKNAYQVKYLHFAKNYYLNQT